MTAPTSLPDDAGVVPVAWYRRRGFVVAAAAVAVLAVAVVTDLPVHASRDSDLAAARSVLGEVNKNVATCAYAVRESYSLYRAAAAGELTDAQRNTATKLLRQDQLACSFNAESSTMYDLSTIQVPGSASGHQLARLVDTTAIWATGDALGSIEQIQVLFARPSDAVAAARLAHYESLLASDRADALGAVSAAEGLLGAPLPALHLPAVNRAGTGQFRL